MLSLLINSISQSYRRIVVDRSLKVATFFVAAFVFAVCQTSNAQQLTSGSSGKQFKQQGIQAIPFEMLTPTTQAKLKPVLEKPSIYRRLPQMSIECDPDYFRFLVRHPEVIVEIWKLMGVTSMQTTRTGPFEVETDDGAGTLSDIELVYGDGNKHIFYGAGTYEGPIIRRKLAGQCVLVLQTEHSTDEQGKCKAVNTLDVYLKVDNVAAGVIARTLQPLVGPTADHNFVESLRFLQRLNETTLRNGAGVQLMGERLDLQPRVLTGFQQVVEIAYKRGNSLESVRLGARDSSNSEFRTIQSR